MQHNRCLIEDPTYVAAVKALGGALLIDYALAPIIDILWREPDVYPIVPGCDPLRLARTKEAVRDLEVVPALYIWFYIAKNGDVHLWNAQIIAESDDPSEEEDKEIAVA